MQWSGRYASGEAGCPAALLSPKRVARRLAAGEALPGNHQERSTMSQVHPRRRESGQPVTIHRPSQATSLPAWQRPDAIATAVPGQPMPEEINGIAVRSWRDAPEEAAGWERIARDHAFDETPFSAGKMQPASGVVVLEPDGRVWVVSPTNQYGGYDHVFPKGKLDPGERISMRANALKEAFEESGLRVELMAFLADARRSTSKTRYYLGRRIGGNPADMGWESQAVHLVPRACLKKFLTHRADAPVLDALARITALERG